MKLASNPRGRNNQIHARSKNSSYQKTNALQTRPMVKKELKDYMYFLGTAKQVSEYESTTLFIINHVKELFCSAEMRIEDGLFKWYPVVKTVVDYEEVKVELSPRGTKQNALINIITHALTLI